MASQPHPERKAVLIEAQRAALDRHPGRPTAFSSASYRQSYSFDSRNSSIAKARATPDWSRSTSTRTIRWARVIQPPIDARADAVPAAAGDPSRHPQPVPRLHYNFAKLPDEPMRPRLADERVGLFHRRAASTSPTTRSSSPKRQLRQSLAPREEGSGRGAVRAEAADRLLDRPQRAGEVPRRRSSRQSSNGTRRSRGSASRTRSQSKMQPDDADFDTLDARHASVRWMTTARPSFGGIGPSQSIRAPARSSTPTSASTRCCCATAASSVSSRFADPVAVRGITKHAEYLCQAADYARAGVGLRARPPRGARRDRARQPRGRAVRSTTLKDVVMHEVGHTLGLRHNFRASTVYTLAQLDDPAFTAAQRHLRLGDGLQRRSTSR